MYQGLRSDLLCPTNEVVSDQTCRWKLLARFAPLISAHNISKYVGQT